MAICPIDGTKIGFMSGWPLSDGEICDTCGEKVGLKRGDTTSEGLSYTYTVNEIKSLLLSNELVSPDHVQQRTENTSTNTNFAKQIEKHNLTDLDSDTLKQVKQIMNGMDSDGLSKIAMLLSTPANMTADWIQAKTLHSIAEQNWILIKQNDDLKKQNTQLLDVLNRIADKKGE